MLQLIIVLQLIAMGFFEKRWLLVVVLLVAVAAVAVVVDVRFVLD